MRGARTALRSRGVLFVVVLLVLQYLLLAGGQNTAGITATKGAAGPASGTSEPGKTVRASDFQEVLVPPTELAATPEEGVWPEEVLEALKVNPPVAQGAKPVQVDDAREGTKAPQRIADFQGVGQTPFLPPDTTGAAGPEHVVETVNSAWRIFTKQGTAVTPLIPFCKANGWWSSVFRPSGKHICTDPKIVYDRFSSRWLMLDLGLTLKFDVSVYLFAFSYTADPTGRWCVWALDATENGSSSTSNWADYPGLGVDRDAIYITSNQFSSKPFQFQYVKVRILDKKKLEENTCGRITWTDFWDLKNPDGTQAFTVQPAQTLEEARGEYLVNATSPLAVTGNSITLWTLTSPLDEPQLTRTALSVGSYGLPPDAKQCKGAERKIETNDPRLLNAVYRNGTLWTAHTIACPTTNKAACLGLIHVDPGGQAQPKVLDDFSYGAPSQGFSYFFPAVAVDDSDNLYVMFNSSSESECVDIRFSGRPSGAQANSLSESSGLHKSEIGYQLPKLFGRNRWGDYSGISPDPQEPNTVWIAGEYAAEAKKWGTWIGGLSFGQGGSRSQPLFVETQNGCASGYSYRVGEDIELAFGVDQEADISLYRLGHSPQQEVLLTAHLPSHGRQTFLLQAERAGVETVVLQAKTRSGPVLTRACTYSVGGVALEAAKVSLDRGCDATYRIGEPITVSLSVQEAADVSVIDFSTDGSVNTIIQQAMQAGETSSINAQVVGPPGIDTLALVAQTSSGLTVTAACSLSIE